MERVAMPHWHFLRDLVLLELSAADGPQRRYTLVGRTIAGRQWPRAVREQAPLASAPTHSTHLGERIDATIGQMARDGLIERPGGRRGYYELTRAGRRAARGLNGRPGVAPDRRRATRPASRQPRDARATDRRGSRTSRAAVGYSPTPAWAADLAVGHWRPYRAPERIVSAAPDLFTWDADEKDAHTREHVDVLTRLAQILVRARCPAVEGYRGRPACDLVYRSPAGTLVIVEAKSLPAGSDEHQMRLGIGQLVQYRAELSPHVTAPIRTLLAVPREPKRAANWRRACESAGVDLIVVARSTRGLRSALLDDRRKPRNV